MSDIRIYVASLSDYNAGILHGDWIDATLDKDEIFEKVQEILKNSPYAKQYGEPAEEWAIHDYEGFDGIKLSEYESFENVSELANAIEKHGELFAKYYSMQASGVEVSDAIQSFQDNYIGEYQSLEYYAEEVVEECYDLKNIPDIIKYHIDYEGIGRDMELNGDIFTIDMGYHCLHVFHNN